MVGGQEMCMMEVLGRAGDLAGSTGRRAQRGRLGSRAAGCLATALLIRASDSVLKSVVTPPAAMPLAIVLDVPHALYSKQRA